MAEAIRCQGPVSGTDKTLSFETGKLAQQTQGAVVASGPEHACSPPPTPPRPSGRASTSSR